jgi:deoxyribodipyrimidine photo-lyase
MSSPINIFWFRRDLRLSDNAGLYHALRDPNPVVPIFIFDRNILDKLEEKSDRRLEFIYNAIQDMQDKLRKLGSSLDVYYDFPENVFKQLLKKYRIEKVYSNHDYEPYARERDDLIKKKLQESGISFHSFKDQVIFEKDEVVKDDKTPYTIFTPYSRRWKSIVNEFYLKPYPGNKYFRNFYKQRLLEIPSLESMGFKPPLEKFASKKTNDTLLKKYEQNRDFPAIEGTSRLGVHLRFGTISIRELASEASKLSDTFLNELIWRDFYHMILWHFPNVGKGNSFKPEYDHIKWRNNESEFEKWCQGMTGYPIVDAGMRQLNATGFMHNRLRMITASFLVKHLLIDWRWGEAYFAEKLLDFDLAANNGGWQWSASCGCDAAPYFRIFNPYLQTKRFDPYLKYIRQWVPELEEFNYPEPVVEHEFARKRALEAYSKALKK